jgi:hypothetical protein
MKFYRLSEIPIWSDDQVFKVSPTGPFIWLTAFSVVAIVLLALGIDGGRRIPAARPLPVFLDYIGAMAFGFFGWMVSCQLRTCLKPTNWLLRCHGSGIIIKYRSYWNWRFPAQDIQAVGFDYSEIAWVRKMEEKHIVQGLDQTRERQKLTCLDFCLHHPDTAALQTHLQAEQRAKFQGKWTTSAVLDYPVEVLPEGIIRLRWRKSGQCALSPSLARALQYPGHHVTIASPDSMKVDLTHQPGRPPREEDAKILKLAQSGDRIAAIELARLTYGSTLTEAVALVEKLQSGG